MILDRGRVLRLDGDAAWVECARRLDCPRCAAGQGCGGGLFARLMPGRPSVVRAALPRTGVAPGDTVVLGVSESLVRRAAFVAYGVPLAGMLAGAVPAGLAGGGDGPAMAGAILGLLFGCVAARRLGTRLLRNPRTRPAILRRDP